MTMQEAAFSDDQLRLAAKERVARLFHVTPDALASEVAFGDGLKASFVSTWKENELDMVLYDIRYVADRQIRRDLESGGLVIRTVGDYCEHMIRCYRSKPKQVIEVLFG